MSKQPTNADFAAALFTIIGYLAFLFGLTYLQWHLAHEISVWWFCGLGTAGLFIGLMISGFMNSRRQ